MRVEELELGDMEQSFFNSREKALSKGIKICPHLINLLIFLADMGFSNDSEGLEKLYNLPEISSREGKKKPPQIRREGLEGPSKKE